MHQAPLIGVRIAETRTVTSTNPFFTGCRTASSRLDQHSESPGASVSPLQRVENSPADTLLTDLLQASLLLMNRLVVATERDAAANERIAATVEQQAAKSLNSSTSATPVVAAVQVDTATNLGPRGINSTVPGPEQLAIGNARGTDMAAVPAAHASVGTRHGPKWARAVDIAKEAKRHGYDDVDYRDLLKVRPKLPDNGLIGKTKREAPAKGGDQMDQVPLRKVAVA